MKTSRIALTLASVMICASVLGAVVRPSAKAVERGKVISLKAIVPTAFGEWRELPDQSTQVVNPQTKEMIDKIYSQTLSRTYVDKQGYRIMLSLAYGDDQRGGLQAHKPEICYPSQGFKVEGITDGKLTTSFGDIGVRRMSTTLGPRYEPVTYWLTVGDKVIRNGFDRRLEEIRLGLTGQIPDGLLFRVSSIDRDPERAFAVQQKFAADMMSSVPVEARRQLSGLAPPATAS